MRETSAACEGCETYKLLDLGEECGDTVCSFDPELWSEVRNDIKDLLIEWYNTQEEDLDAADRLMLAKLHEEGKIQFSECEQCGETCFDAQPDNWDDFQGTGVGMQQGIYGDFCGSCASEIMEKAKRTDLPL